jgi:hypothetical protein
MAPSYQGEIARYRQLPPDLIPSMTRRTARALDAIGEATLRRTAIVRSEGIVQTEKVKEIDHLTREAITGHALLSTWRDTLAHGDPFLADELRFFTDAARLGKGEVIADTIDTFCRESRR